MVNCWQGGSRSATVVLAFLIQHQQMSLDEALVLVKKKRDIRPNNGFLTQLITLEETLLHGMNKNLICLETKEGRHMLNLSAEERLTHYEVMKKYFDKQSHNTFCGVQSCCIILNTVLDAREYNEATFWSIENVRGVLDESVVRQSGMTLVQCRDLLNSFPHVSAVSHHTSQSQLDTFRGDVVRGLSSNVKVSCYHVHTAELSLSPADCCQLRHVSAGPAGGTVRPPQSPGWLLQRLGQDPPHGRLVGDEAMLGQTGGPLGGHGHRGQGQHREGDRDEECWAVIY